MIGECTGKVRSTPTPKLTLRTVNVSRAPLALAPDHDALEHLDPLAVAFDHADVHLQGVAGGEVGDVVAQLGAVDEIGAVHELELPELRFLAKQCGRREVRGGRVMLSAGPVARELVEQRLRRRRSAGGARSDRVGARWFGAAPAARRHRAMRP